MLELVHSILTVIGTYRMTVTSLTNPALLNDFTFLVTGILMGGLSGIVVLVRSGSSADCDLF